MAKNPNAAKLGEVGEEFVANSLTTRGMRVLDRNWRIKEGEIDLGLEDREGTIILIEVKTRSSVSHGDPLGAMCRNRHISLRCDGVLTYKCMYPMH
ncbi:MAG: YraN family protein [Actinomycetota bacterium]